MSGKITAHFGADVSEVESKMLQATRATKRYEQAVKSLDRQSAFGGINAGAPKALANVKALAGAFGQAGMAAGLVPGLGMAAIGVAGLTMAVKYVADKYKEAAESAKEIAEYMSRAGARQAAADDSARTDKERLDLQRAQTAELKTQWMIAVGAGRTDKEILAAREKWDISRFKLADMERANNKVIAEEEKRAREAHSKQVDEDFKLEEENHKRNLEVQKNIADAEKAAAEQKKKSDDDEKKRVVELAELKQERAMRFATEEEKLAQLVKEGREAQAKADANASTENLIALEKVRAKYLDLIDAMNGKKSGSAAPDSSSGDGSRIVRGVKVSAEDAARSDSTRSRNAQLEAESKRGHIRESGKVGSINPNDKTDKLLEEIRNSLKPSSLS
jgi:hypothetical protein